jgi:N-acetyl-gamma-glutamylphosphate reductase
VVVRPPGAATADAGQALQNANIALGLPETAGLRLDSVLV